VSPDEKTFRRYDPDQTMLPPTDPREWLPEDHLAYFISDIVDVLCSNPLKSDILER
jgi:hypothetical protein